MALIKLTPEPVVMLEITKFSIADNVGVTVTAVFTVAVRLSAVLTPPVSASAELRV